MQIQEARGLPPECDGLVFNVEYEYHPHDDGGRDYPTFPESVEITSLESTQGDCFMWLLDDHQEILEAEVLEVLNAV